MFKFIAAILFLFSISTEASSVHKMTATGDHVPNQLIIKVKDGSLKSLIMPMSSEMGTKFRSSGAQVVTFPNLVDIDKVMADLKNNPNIEYVEYNNIYELTAAPDDSRYSRLYGMENINAPAAWDITTGSKDIVVGVIDTGIDYNHPDIAANYWSNPGETGLDADGNDKATNGIDDDNNGYVDDFRGWDFINGDNDPMDGNGHGTHCAGTIGAVGNNGIGVAGVNWEVSLVGLKIFSDAGSTTAEAIVEAIEYSTAIGVDVSNNSWGGGGPSETIRAAIQETSDAGIMFVAAAGNSGADTDARGFFPANYEIDGIISVAATDSRNQLARFSNYGATKVDVGAPGVDIYSTEPGGGYQLLSGTSMAAPHVAGLVALIKSEFRDISLTELKTRVLRLGTKEDALAGKTLTGRLINAASSLEIDTVAPSAVTDIRIEDSSLDSLEISWTAAGDDGDEGEASDYEIRTSDVEITAGAWEESQKTSYKVMSNEDGVVRVKVEGLPLNYSGFIAVKAIDNINNYGPVSNSVEVAVLKAEVSYQNEGSSLEGVTVEGAWGLEEIGEGKMAFSDSPSGNYADGIDSSLTLASIAVTDTRLSMIVRTKYALENKYDKGYIEISPNTSDEWIEVDVLNGTEDWSNKSYDLSKFLEEGVESFQVRFRITSDSTINFDGWLVDNVAIINPAE